MNTSPVHAQFFDGQTARVHEVVLHIERDTLQVRGDSAVMDFPTRQVDWGEYTRHGTRMVHLPGGASLQVKDGQALEALLAAQGIRSGKVANLTARWPIVLAALAVLVALLVGGYFWGIPAGARVAAPLIPQAYQRVIGESTLKYLDQDWLKPTALSKERQEALRVRWKTIVARTYPDNSAPTHTVLFRKLKAGPNAFALPGGTIVLTDELVNMMQGDEDAIMGVLAHELGHLKHHHSMRLLIEVSALTIAGGMIIGDYSGFLANAPLILGQLSYTRNHEREADQEALRVITVAGLDRIAMVRFFENARAWKPATGKAEEDGDETDEKSATSDPKESTQSHRRMTIPELLSSHPLDEERIAFFRQGG